MLQRLNMLVGNEASATRKLPIFVPGQGIFDLYSKLSSHFFNFSSITKRHSDANFLFGYTTPQALIQ